MEDNKKLQAYRFITGLDDANFCKRVADALEQGWVLYGDPKLVYNKKEKMMHCGQAVIRPEFSK